MPASISGEYAAYLYGLNIRRLYEAYLYGVHTAYIRRIYICVCIYLSNISCVAFPYNLTFVFFAICLCLSPFALSFIGEGAPAQADF